MSPLERRARSVTVERGANVTALLPVVAIVVTDAGSGAGEPAGD
jgi:hypothetical protein